ncbi:MAG: tRNA-(ms[2]io[6]A)-hydroxylase [Myxococcales bacterium]|nr:tRNA-(ms[2]io[6]A)-hydroxylase [Myxococcales bacterium]
MLGLETSSDPAWAARAAASLDRVLVDHAHCEMKAASNALALAARCSPWPRVVRALVELAEEELVHFRRVLEEIERRGLSLGPPEEDFYAAELRRRVAATRTRRDLGDVVSDRLLVGALIEARSCERFKLLRDELAQRGDALAPFYDELFTAEAKHYADFIDLAGVVLGEPAKAKARYAALARIEASVVESLPGDVTVHG